MSIKITKEKIKEISFEILNYLADTDTFDMDTEKEDLKIFKLYLGKISAFVNFSTVWDSFKQDFEYCIKDVVGKELKFEITEIEPDTIHFEIENYEVVCFVDNDFLEVEWNKKEDK